MHVGVIVAGAVAIAIVTQTHHRRVLLPTLTTIARETQVVARQQFPCQVAVVGRDSSILSKGLAEICQALYIIQFGGVYMKKITTIIFIIFAVINFTACGRGENGTNTTSTESRLAGSLLGYSHTLTVAGASHEMAMLREAGDRLIERLAYDGISLTIEYESFANSPPEARAEYFNSLPLRLVAGQGPDILFNDGEPLYPLIRLGLLANIYEIIDAVEGVNRDDFYKCIGFICYGWATVCYAA